MGFLVYVVSINLMSLGTDGLASGKLPMALGLWWLVLPTLAMSLWVYLRDGRMRPRRGFPAVSNATPGPPRCSRSAAGTQSCRSRTAFRRHRT